MIGLGAKISTAKSLDAPTLGSLSVMVGTLVYIPSRETLLDPAPFLNQLVSHSPES